MTVVHTYFYIVVYAQRGCHTLKPYMTLRARFDLTTRIKNDR